MRSTVDDPRLDDVRPTPREVTVVVVACLAAFAAVLGHDFVDWDDREMVVRNTMLAAGHFGDVLAAYTRPTLGLYAPLTYTAYAWLAAVGRTTSGELDPTVFHAANLLVHAAGGVLVLWLLLRLGGDRRSALVGGLVWAVHPLQAEPVSWVGSLNTCLCGVLALAALLCQTLAWGQSSVSRRRAWFAAAMAAAVLSLCAKPASVGLPLAALGLNRFVLRRTWRESIAVTSVGGLLAIPFVCLGAAAQPTVNAFGLTTADRVFVAGHAIAFYLYKTLVPFGYTIDYGLSPDVVLARPWLKWSGLAVLLVAAGVLWQRRRRPWLIGAAAVFLAGILPVSGLRNFEFQNISTVADRYAYVALLGPAMFVAIALRGRLQLKAAFAGALLVTSLLGAVCFSATLKWRDSRTLDRATLRANPGSLAALVLEGDRALDAGDSHAVEAVCRRFLQSRPLFPPINQTLGSLLLRTGRPGEAIEPLRRLLQIQPTVAAYNDLAVALARTDQADAAVRLLGTAVAAFPGHAGLYATRGEIFRRTNRPADAAADFRTALSLDPDNALARQGLDDVSRP